MIISYPASPRRIIVLLKTLRRMIENLKKKGERKDCCFRENRKKGIKCNKQKGRENLNVLQRFRSKLNEFLNLASRGERKGFALEKITEIICSELL